MIRVPQLLLAISDRVRIWTFHDIFATAQAAKKVAAKLFVTETGVVVRKVGPKSHVVLSWHPERGESND